MTKRPSTDSMSGTAIPQTPTDIPPSQGSVGSSPSGSISPDPVHDLPPELLQAGWRKFWSGREKRPYFFNKMTNESLWETPQLSGVPRVCLWFL